MDRVQTYYTGNTIVETVLFECELDNWIMQVYLAYVEHTANQTFILRPGSFDTNWRRHGHQELCQLKSDLA